jgi:hypothetical protein
MSVRRCIAYWTCVTLESTKDVDGKQGMRDLLWSLLMAGATGMTYDVNGYQYEYAYRLSGTST